MNRPKNFPTYPGIYIFRRGARPLYVGKALNLKKRVVSYFQDSANKPVKIQKMLEEATSVKFIRTASEIEALILEAKLIKAWRPKYNVLMRDDKSYFYVAITKEQFPRIFTTHQPYRDKKIHKSRYIGPFTGGTELYATLKLLRRIFPYCTCKGVHSRPCLQSQIGKCPGYCCLAHTAFRARYQSARVERQLRAEYRRNIRNVESVLLDTRTHLLSALKKSMKDAVRKEHYEYAGQLRDQIAGLEDIHLHQGVLHTPKERYPWPMIESSLRKILALDHAIHRIEGYDISNISGTEATGSLVVFTAGRSDTSQYRKFRIKTVSGSNDVAMHQEVIRRRFAHPEWPRPDIVVIDGGKPQLSAVLKVVNQLRAKNEELRMTLVTALAKREEILFRENGSLIMLKRQDQAVLHFFQRVRDESHRFALAYHHKLRKVRNEASTR